MATAAQRARYSSLRGDFEDTAASRLLDRILVDLQIEFIEVSGPAGCCILYFGMFRIRGTLSNVPGTRRLQLRRMVVQHMRERRANRKTLYPTDGINKQQSGKFQRT
jgi:hypothetical protein